MVEELSLSHDSTTFISVYPNPANNELNINIDDELNEDYSFYIVDSNGMIVIKDKNKKIDISSLFSGSYILYGVYKNMYVISETFIKK